MIYVKAKEGRIARVSPTGAFIPNDAYIKVQPSEYIQRLIDVHKDIEIMQEPKPAKAPINLSVKVPQDPNATLINKD
jgi:hypothetical protein